MRQKFDTRIDTLQSHLESREIPEDADGSDRLQEVWSLTGHVGIESRTHNMLEDAESEIVLLVVEEEILTETLLDRLHEATDRGVNVTSGGKTESIVSESESELQSVKVFETDLGWLMGPASDDEVAISRLLLVDRSACLAVRSTRRTATRSHTYRPSSRTAWRTAWSSSSAD